MTQKVSKTRLQWSYPHSGGRWGSRRLDTLANATAVARWGSRRLDTLANATAVAHDFLSQPP
jgi:hypothetical protein